MPQINAKQDQENIAGQISGGAAGISLERLTKKFGSFTAVDNVSLHIQKGEFITLLGPSGSGKTTTLMMIAGFLFPTSGDIFIGDESIASKPPNKRNIGIVFQNYSLFPHMTVFENIAFPLKMRKVDSGRILKRVKEVLELVKLSEFEQRYPKQLSGGQQQRVALVRALVFNPPILLMDEPLGALDKNLRETMQLEIKEIQERLNITTISVTHDQSEALTMSDRIVVMDHGRVEQIESPENLYERPVNRFVAGFIGESNFLEGRVTHKDENVVQITSDESIQFNVYCEGNLQIGKNTCVAIRPEKLTFFAGDEKQAGWNSIDGVIEEEVYLGEVRRYKVRIADEQFLVIKISSGMDIENYRRNDRVKVGWKWRDAIVV